MARQLSPEAREVLRRIVWQACAADVARQQREREAAATQK